MGSYSQRLGYEAETRAARYLVKHGLTLLTRNFKTRCGEIDLIMQHGQVLVFVEVRRRSCNEFGAGLDTINLAKQRRLIKTAWAFIQRHHDQPDLPPSRFDVVSIDNACMGEHAITWICDAFQVQ